MMKKYLPFVIGGLGLVFIALSMFLRNGVADTTTAITNLVSTFMMVGGVICIIAGLVTFFLRDDPEIW